MSKSKKTLNTSAQVFAQVFAQVNAAQGHPKLVSSNALRAGALLLESSLWALATSDTDSRV